MSDSLATSVAVSKRPGSAVRVGVLSFHNSKETKAILNAVAALGHQPVWLREDNTRTWMVDGELRFDPDVDVVVNRLLTTKAERPVEDLGVASSFEAARPILNPPSAVLRAMHKYGAAATLAAAGLPVPDAYMAFDFRTMDPDDRPFVGPTVHKPAIGTNGNRMSLLPEASLASPRISRRRAFLQSFLESDAERPYDTRVYVVDGEVLGAMRRYAPETEWRTNVALGGAVEDVSADLPAAAVDYARRAAAALGLDYAGVDLLCRDGDWYVLEVNATAGFKGFFEATGISPAAAIARQAIARGEGRVDADRVDELSSVLDDSRPACTPDDATDAVIPETVGLTEQVVVGGTRGVERVTAKADTGAKRTSIDLGLAADIGAGPLVGRARIRTGAAGRGRRRPLVELAVMLGTRWHTTTASLEDRDHMSYPVLLGRDVLRGHQVDIRRRADEE